MHKFFVFVYNIVITIITLCGIHSRYLLL